MDGVEKAVRSYWGKRGEQVVQDNLTCIRRGYQEVFEVPRELINDASIDETAPVVLPVVAFAITVCVQLITGRRPL